MRWLKRIGIGFLAVLAAAVLIGSAYELWARHRVKAEFPAPGTLVDIGGRRIGSSRGREIRLEDAHHYIQFERPDAVVDAIREGVDSIRGA